MATYRPGNIALGQPLSQEPGLRKLKENPVSRKALGNVTQSKAPLQQAKRQPLGSLSLKHVESSQNISGIGSKARQEKKAGVKKRVKKRRDESTDGPIEYIHDRPWAPIEPPTEDDAGFATLIESIHANARNAGNKKERSGGATLEEMQRKGIYEDGAELMMDFEEIGLGLSATSDMFGDADDALEEFDFGDIGAEGGLIDLEHF